MNTDTLMEDASRPTRAMTLGGLERWGSVTTAAALMLYGVSRRSPAGIGLALAATPLAYRGLAGRWPPQLQARLHRESGDTRDALAGDRGFLVHESVRLERPVAEVYSFWRRFENLPRFMDHLHQVTETGDGRSHWSARGPAGVLVEWDAEIINEVENQVIGWRSLPGGDVTVAGSVNFDTVRAGQSTQLTVRLRYAPPAGRVGAFVSMLAGREPSQTIREDLRRLKQILEAGELARATAPRGGAAHLDKASRAAANAASQAESQTDAPGDIVLGESHELWRMP
jgi:uncharacterized membrane protein